MKKKKHLYQQGLTTTRSQTHNHIRRGLVRQGAADTTVRERLLSSS